MSTCVEEIRTLHHCSRQTTTNLSAQLQEELQEFRHLKMDECRVHEEVETRGPLARSEKSCSDVQGGNLGKLRKVRASTSGHRRVEGMNVSPCLISPLEAATPRFVCTASRRASGLCRHLKIEESSVHEEVEIRGTLARLDKSCCDVRGCNL